MTTSMSISRLLTGLVDGTMTSALAATAIAFGGGATEWRHRKSSPCELGAASPSMGDTLRKAHAHSTVPARPTTRRSLSGGDRRAAMRSLLAGTDESWQALARHRQ